MYLSNKEVAIVVYLQESLMQLNRINLTELDTEYCVILKNGMDGDNNSYILKKFSNKSDSEDFAYGLNKQFIETYEKIKNTEDLNEKKNIYKELKEEVKALNKYVKYADLLSCTIESKTRLAGYYIKDYSIYGLSVNGTRLDYLFNSSGFRTEDGIKEYLVNEFCKYNNVSYNDFEKYLSVFFSKREMFATLSIHLNLLLKDFNYLKSKLEEFNV